VNGGNIRAGVAYPLSQKVFTYKDLKVRPKKERRHAFLCIYTIYQECGVTLNGSFMQSPFRLSFSLLLLSFPFRPPIFPFRCRQKSLSLAKWSPFAYPDLSSPPFSSILANLPSWIPPSRKGASCRYVSFYPFIPLHPPRPLALLSFVLFSLPRV
jgi:hypothetical protein